MDDGGRVDPAKLKIPVLVQYITTHGTWTDCNELWQLLSEQVVRIALRLADEQLANHEAQRKLQADAASNLSPDWFGPQRQARENCASQFRPVPFQES